MPSNDQEKARTEQREAQARERAAQERAAEERETQAQDRAEQREGGKDDADAPADEPARSPAATLAETGAFGQAAGFAVSANAANGEVMEVPKTPQEVAEAGTRLGLAGDFSTGGNPPEPADPDAETPTGPQFERVWGMDADHTTRNRNDPDGLKPDLSVQVSG